MAAPDFPHPLTEQHLVDINNALDGIKKARAAIALAQRAGINVDAQSRSADDTEQQLLKIKQVYFPNR